MMTRRALRRSVYLTIGVILGVAGPAFAAYDPARLAAGSGAVALGVASLDTEGIWSDVADAAPPAGAAPTGVSGAWSVLPLRYRMVTADITALDGRLAQAPPEGAGAGVILTLPLPDGSAGRFRITRTPIMEDGLALHYPEIGAWAGQGIDDPAATVRLDRSPGGFHAMILSPGGTVLMDPYRRGDDSTHISYRKRDLVKNPLLSLSPELLVPPAADASLTGTPAVPAAALGTQLRTYRLAVGATGEFTQYFGGTVPQALAAIVTTINRLNGILEREFSVRLILVANTDLLIFTNPLTDPYSNTNGFSLLVENQSVTDLVIGDPNYDLGNVFTTAGGGALATGVVCRSGVKAQSATGSPQPLGDAFDVDIVAHTFGHKLGANHSFNSTSSLCGGLSRNAATAWETGSGSTIMGFAGACGSANLQLHSDDYFHTGSFDEVFNYLTVGGGAQCGSLVPTGNNPPVVSTGPGATIPIQTPFTLAGTATDPDGDALTYAWEEIDLGAASPPDLDDGSRPIFRSFPPSATPSRTFPQLTDVLYNSNIPAAVGESLPTTTRTLSFRLTARDNQAGGSAVNYTPLTIDTTQSAGPFTVTAPNTPVVWTPGTQQTISWNVAGTDLAPVSCPSVNILLSTDGGYLFDRTLAVLTPNDGSQSVLVPDVPTYAARVKVECANNIFFDIGNSDFSILPGAPASVLSTGVVLQYRTNTPRDVRAKVKTADASGGSVGGAVVSATFTLPDGSVIAVTDTTNRKGIARLPVTGPPGLYAFTVTNITANGYVFDPAGSVLTGSILVP